MKETKALGLNQLENVREEEPLPEWYKQRIRNADMYILKTNQSLKVLDWKCWTESGDRGVNNSSTGPEPTHKKLSGKHKKQIKRKI